MLMWGEWGWPAMAVLWLLFLIALLLSMRAVVKEIRHQGEETRKLTQTKTGVIEARLDVVHALVNSNLQTVKAALEEANKKILRLEESLVTLTEARMRASARTREGD